MSNNYCSHNNSIVKPIPGFQYHLICDKGCVISLPRNGTKKHHHILAVTLEKNGYVRCTIREKNRSSKIGLHRLLAMAFLGLQFNDNKVVDHINSIKNDNRLENLRICTATIPSKQVNVSTL